MATNKTLAQLKKEAATKKFKPKNPPRDVKKVMAAAAERKRKKAEAEKKKARNKGAMARGKNAAY